MHVTYGKFMHIEQRIGRISTSKKVKNNIFFLSKCMLWQLTDQRTNEAFPWIKKSKLVIHLITNNRMFQIKNQKQIYVYLPEVINNFPLRL